MSNNEAPDNASKCSECGRPGDLRPYGKNGADICFACGMKDEERTAAEFRRLMPRGNGVLTEHGPLPYIGPISHE